MAKTFTRASQIYPAGTYGPFSVDGLTNADTDYLELTLSVEGWPDVAPLFLVSIMWDSGYGNTFEINGNQIDRSGNPRTQLVLACPVPFVADSNGNPTKDAVASGNITFQVFQSFRTAVSLAAK